MEIKDYIEVLLNDNIIKNESNLIHSILNVVIYILFFSLYNNKYG